MAKKTSKKKTPAKKRSAAPAVAKVPYEPETPEIYTPTPYYDLPETESVSDAETSLPIKILVGALAVFAIVYATVQFFG